MLAYFPSAPPSPPSPSATAERYSVKLGLINIFTSFKNIMTGIAFASINIPMMWITVANQNLHPLGLSQVSPTDSIIKVDIIVISRKTLATSAPSSSPARL